MSAEQVFRQDNRSGHEHCIVDGEGRTLIDCMRDAGLAAKIVSRYNANASNAAKLAMFDEALKLLARMYAHNANMNLLLSCYRKNRQPSGGLVASASCNDTLVSQASELLKRAEALPS